MALSVPYSGSAVIGDTERSLTSNSNVVGAIAIPGVYQAVVDLTNLQAGDTVELRVVERATEGGAQGTVLRRQIVGGGPEPVVVLAALQLCFGFDFTLRRIAGTSRTLSWSIRRAS